MKKKEYFMKNAHSEIFGSVDKNIWLTGNRRYKLHRGNDVDKNLTS